MSLLPCNNKRPNPTEKEILDQKTNRDIGLSNVYNIYKDVVPCIEDYENPSYSISGACNVFSGDLTAYTSTCSGTTYSHNLSEVDDITLTFDLYGSNQYTGYTGQFCYKLGTRLEPPVNFSSKCYPYSGITGNSISSVLSLSDIPRYDNEFVLETWNIFDSQCVSGLTINTSNYTYDDNSKNFYMVGYTNPPEPQLSFIGETPVDLTFVNEVIQPLVVGGNKFLLNNTVVGNSVIVTVNGVFMNVNDYTVNSSTTPGITTIDFNTGYTFNVNDVVQASYNVGGGNAFDEQQAGSYVNLDIFGVTGITSGFTSSATATTYNNIVNENIINNRYEIFLQNNMNSSVNPIVTINGVNLTYNIDVFISNVVSNKLILREGLTVEVGDVISVYYQSNVNNGLGDLGNQLTNTPTVSWSVPLNVLRGIPDSVSASTGVFTVEVAEKSDTTYTTVITSGVTNYNNNTTDYSLQIGPITTTSISDYIYRVKFTKNYYTTIVKNTYTTNSFSDNGSFTLDWNYINNTNF